MPNLPITGLPVVTNPNPTDPFAIVNGGVTKQIAMQDVSSTVFNNISSSVILPSQTGSFVVSEYLSAYHTASMINPVLNTPNTMSFSTTDFNQGVTVSGSFSDKLKIANTGIYNIQFSAQFDKSTSANSNAYVWLSKNGTDIPTTNTGLTLGGGSNDAAVAAWNFFVSASANDYFQIKWAGTETNTRILYVANPPVGPAVPSIIVTVNRVG